MVCSKDVIFGNKVLVLTCLHVFRNLANESLESGKLAWQLLPQQHTLEHLFPGFQKDNENVNVFHKSLKHVSRPLPCQRRCLDWIPSLGNARNYSLYLDEDLIERIK